MSLPQNHKTNLTLLVIGLNKSSTKAYSQLFFMLVRFKSLSTKQRFVSSFLIIRRPTQKAFFIIRKLSWSSSIFLKRLQIMYNKPYNLMANLHFINSLDNGKFSSEWI